LRVFQFADVLSVGRWIGVAMATLLWTYPAAATVSNDGASTMAFGGVAFLRTKAVEVRPERGPSGPEAGRARLPHLVRYQQAGTDTELECERIRQSPGERVLSCTLELLRGTQDNEVRARLYAQRASAYYLAGEWQIALRDFERALELDPDLPFALNGRCWILATQNLDLAQARRDCDRAIGLDPTFPETFDSRAIIDMREGDWAAAWRDFDKAISLRSDVPAFLYGRGLASLALGDSDAAQQDMAAAISLDPSVVADYRRLGFDAAALHPGNVYNSPSGN
jgi:predicted Zn-dependent protease